MGYVERLAEWGEARGEKMREVFDRLVAGGASLRLADSQQQDLKWPGSDTFYRLPAAYVASSPFYPDNALREWQYTGGSGPVGPDTIVVRRNLDDNKAYLVGRTKRGELHVCTVKWEG